MNYTENYHLPQWEETDRILRKDFNDAMASIETGMKNAQDTASNAFAPGRFPYTVGSYVGNGGTTTILLGFRPRFLILTGQTMSGSDNYTRGIMIAGPGLMTNALAFLDNGFSITNYDSIGTYNGDRPRMNNLDTRYHYIAFR